MTAAKGQVLLKLLFLLDFLFGLCLINSHHHATIIFEFLYFYKYLSLYLSITLSIYPYITVSVCPSLFLSVNLSINTSSLQTQELVLVLLFLFLDFSFDLSIINSNHCATTSFSPKSPSPLCHTSLSLTLPSSTYLPTSTFYVYLPTYTNLCQPTIIYLPASSNHYILIYNCCRPRSQY